MEQSETKVLPLALTNKHRTRLGVMAAERCVAMTELVRWWIDEKWAGRTSGVVGKTPTMDQKHGSVESGYVDLNKLPMVDPKPSSVPMLRKFGVPVTDDEVPEKRCFKCKGKVREWTMTEKGPLCPDCKSQMEVSIP